MISVALVATCSKIVEAVGSVLGFIFDGPMPGFARVINDGHVLADIGCDEVDGLKEQNNHKRDLERGEADNLAKAWQKEMRKTRNLPMKEHKEERVRIISSLIIISGL